MSTKAIKRKREEGPLAGDFQVPAERAPSILRTDQPTFARIVALVALLSGSVGAFALILMAAGRATLVSAPWAVVFLAAGVAGLVYHAATEKDQQYRRIYGVLGAVLLVAGAIFLLLPARGGIGGLFLPAGVPCLGLSLAFLLAFIRNETDMPLRDAAVKAVGVAGALLVLIAAIGGLISDDFLLGQGAVMLVLGLFYLMGYVGTQPTGSERGYWAGLALGVLGALMILIVLGRLFLPSLFDFVRWRSGQPGAPFLYFYAGLEYLLLAVGVCSDAKWVVLTRRELASYFYSPIAYVVLIAVAGLGLLSFWLFAGDLRDDSLFRGGIPEPIVTGFIFSLLPVLSVICVVPIVTMRLLSEEQRSGTLEVMLTAPVNEWSVVLSKFLAAWRFFMLVWYAWGLYLVALRIEGGEEFDYRPLLSFAIALAITGAQFVSMGLFFSAVTRNQIAAAILTLMGMLLQVGVYILKFVVGRGAMGGSSAWATVATYVSFLDLWLESARGNVVPRMYLFHLSATVFWLFLTVKVLEARKWR
jgi:ABC-type transport system involved in multi-copper enzyme maturation permease subunit